MRPPMFWFPGMYIYIDTSPPHSARLSYRTPFFVTYLLEIHTMAEKFDPVHIDSSSENESGHEQDHVNLNSNLSAK